jgi:hypothetical protein
MQVEIATLIRQLRGNQKKPPATLGIETRCGELNWERGGYRPWDWGPVSATCAAMPRHAAVRTPVDGAALPTPSRPLRPPSGSAITMPHQNDISERRINQLFVPGLAAKDCASSKEYPLVARESLARLPLHVSADGLRSGGR